MITKKKAGGLTKKSEKMVQWTQDQDCFYGRKHGFDRRVGLLKGRAASYLAPRKIAK